MGVADAEVKTHFSRLKEYEIILRAPSFIFTESLDSMSSSASWVNFGMVSLNWSEFVYARTTTLESYVPILTALGFFSPIAGFHIPDRQQNAIIRAIAHGKVIFDFMVKPPFDLR
jgi:hypothetical protein